MAWGSSKKSNPAPVDDEPRGLGGRTAREQLELAADGLAAQSRRVRRQGDNETARKLHNLSIETRVNASKQGRK